MRTLFIRLEGPLQAWGTRAQWEQRDTARDPTKSGVIGLISCALGRGPADAEDIHEMSERLRLGVRVDREGHLLEDFHTVVGGVLSADGKIKKTASTGKTETIVSHRHYLCDASFLAALQGREDLIQRASACLQNPVWPPFLGRRSCVPSRPFWAGMGDYETLENALIDFEAPKHSTRLRLVVECEPGEGVRRSDQVVSYPLRTYASRYVRELLVDFPSLQEAEVS